MSITCYIADYIYLDSSVIIQFTQSVYRNEIRLRNNAMEELFSLQNNRQWVIITRKCVYWINFVCRKFNIKKHHVIEKIHYVLLQKVQNKIVDSVPARAQANHRSLRSSDFTGHRSCSFATIRSAVIRSFSRSGAILNVTAAAVGRVWWRSAQWQTGNDEIITFKNFCVYKVFNST